MNATSLFRLPRRTPRTRPAHARGAVPAPAPARAAGFGCVPLPVTEAEDLHGIAPEQTPAVRPVPVPHLDAPTGFPPASAWSTGPEVLKQAAAALRALPAFPNAYLRCITPGDAANAVDSLPGVPSFAGIARMSDGRAYAGLYLGDEDGDGRLVLDVLDIAWLGRLIDAAEEARERLYALQQAASDEAAESEAAA